MIDGVSPILGAALLVSVAGNWWSRWRVHAALEYLTKPLATALIVVLAVTIDAASRWEQAWLVAGLVFCLAGDVFLMLAKERFIAGLGSFLVGHVAFIVGYGLSPRAGSTAAAGAGLIAIGLLSFAGLRIVRAVRSGDPRLLGPVLAYVVVIMTMVVAVGWGGRAPALAGAVMFAVSDTILAWGRFVRGPARESAMLRVAVMVTYHVALVLLTLALR